MQHVRVFATATAPVLLLQRVRRLLEDAFDGDFSAQDYRQALGGWHVVVVECGQPLAHAAVVPRVLEIANRRWATGYVEAVATSPDRRGEGLGSRAMTELGGLLRRQFDLGALGTSRHGFYERCGWDRWQGPTYARRAGARVRTENQDSGLMVLRFGPSRTLDLTLPVASETRYGEAW